jgi:Holliday junction resolvasome RuvABC endonuclease subunit
VRILLGLATLPEPEDVTDALAVALADAHRSGLGQIRGTAASAPDVEEGIVEEG